MPPCSESGTLGLGGDQYGSQSTDVVPTQATSATENVQPSGSVTADDFDQMWAVVVDGQPKLGKIGNKTVQRVLTCSFLAGNDTLRLLDLFNEGPQDEISASNGYAAFMLMCLSVAFDLQTNVTHDLRAGAAKSRCSHKDVAFTVAITRTSKGYTAKLVGKTRNPRGHTPLAVSCKSKGKGFQINVEPRKRHKRLGPLVGPHLQLGYSNPTKHHLAVHTTFTFR